LDQYQVAFPGIHEDQSQVSSSTVEESATTRHLLPTLPDRLIEMAQIPFPETKLFQEALRSDQALDESELAQYELDPPYTPPSYPTSTNKEQEYTDKMAEVLRGRLIRERLKFEDHRIRMWSGEKLLMERKQELLTLLKKWEALNDYLKSYQAGQREMRMAAHLLQWRSYLIQKLASQIEQGNNLG
jgi:hypothetical protein